MTREDIDKELRHAKTIFEKYDTDHSGNLGSDEIRPMMVDTYKALNSNYDPTDKEVKEYIDMIDKDGDGEISL